MNDSHGNKIATTESGLFLALLLFCNMEFIIDRKTGFARATTIFLEHGKVETPVFMPIGTCGVVKTLCPNELIEVGTSIILANTYHLFLRPGIEVIESFCGLHNFMNWKKPILTDSGGFQIFSLAKLRKISDEGVLFQNHIDGREFLLTPEKSAEVQSLIGSDIAMALDECVELPNDCKIIEQAVKRSLVWAKRFLNVPKLKRQLRFGIVQGGNNIELRYYSLEKTLELDFDGIAIGGLSVGEPHGEMVSILENIKDKLPDHMPHYLMGVGTPLDILEAVSSGIDMFDCVLPTRNARNASFFTDSGAINIRNSAFKLDKRPIDEECSCYCCRNFSRAYLRHLFLQKEILGCRLATHHNLHYYHNFMRKIRESIISGTFGEFYKIMRQKLSIYLKESE